jgi:hypothetical protein
MAFAHKHEAERYLLMLSAVIAHSQIVVMLPDATVQRLPANFDAVDITVLEWIAAEGRRLAARLPTTHLEQTHYA